MNFKLTLCVFLMPFFGACKQGQIDGSEISGGSTNSVQTAAKGLLKDLGIPNYLNEKHETDYWTHKSVPDSIVKRQLEKWRGEIGLSAPLPQSQLCMSLANVIRKRAGFSVYGGNMAGYIPSVVADLLKKGGKTVPWNQIVPGDIASDGGGHAGVVVLISTGAKKVLAFTGNPGNGLDAQIVPTFDSWKFYRAK